VSVDHILVSMKKSASIQSSGLALSLIIISISEILNGQALIGKKVIPRDTTYQVSIVAKQIAREFPYAVPAKDNTPEGVKEIRDLVYVTLPETPYGKRELHLDIFRPEQAGTYPALIMIHGGGWRSGTKGMQVPLAQQVAAKGYVTVCVEYRLSMEALYPAAIFDIKAAIRFVRAKAKKFNIDPDRIAISGCSAGGQLAALIGMTDGVKKFEGDEGYLSVSSKVQAIIDIDGILDFTDPNESAKDNDPAKRSAGAYWFGATYKEKPKLWIEASPLIYAGSNTPPMLFINSALPRFHAGRDSVIAILNKHDIYTEVHTIPVTPHPFWLFHPWFSQTAEYMTAFLDKVFKD
jgi:acetyl esterase/lipase